MKRSAKEGIAHWGAANLPEKYRAIWGIAAIVSQYFAIWGHWALRLQSVKMPKLSNKNMKNRREADQNRTFLSFALSYFQHVWGEGYVSDFEPHVPKQIGV